jgi:hypothetical protein
MTELRGTASVLSHIDTERSTLREELRVLDEVARHLRLAVKGANGKSSIPSADGTIKPQRRRPRTKSGAVSRSPEAAAKRRGEYHRFLLENGRSTPGQLRAAFPDTGAKALRAAIKRLEEEGKVRRKGQPKRPLYEAVGEPGGQETLESLEGTLGGRLLGFIQENDGATLAQLMAATGVTEQEVRAECGRLIREGEIRFERRGDDLLYVPQASA